MHKAHKALCSSVIGGFPCALREKLRGPRGKI